MSDAPTSTALATVLRVKNRDLDRARENHSRAAKTVAAAKDELTEREEQSRKPLLRERTGVEDVYALVAMLIQTDRLGTSVAHALRAHADSMRVKRRQRAEQMARKAAVKLAFPLVFLVLPALLIIILLFRPRGLMGTRET